MSITTTKNLAVANDNVAVYIVPAGVELARVDLSLTAIGSSPVTTDIYITSSNTPDPEDMIEYQESISSNYTRSCILMKPGEKIVVRADSNDLAIRVAAMELESEE